jgi:release factor glutamine methyltransferase
MSHSTATEQSWTVGGLLDWTAGFLAKKGAESPRLDAEVLLAHALNWKRIDLYARFDETASAEVRNRYRELVRKRIEGCPVAYLVGRKEFFSLTFEVSPAVLIPRPDTETLVVECLRLAKAMAGPTVLDIGTGSGCIAVAVAKQHRTAQATAIDLSPQALDVARRNAEKHGVAERLRFLQGDLFTPLAGDERFDFVLSNPPYIAHEDMEKLPVGVRQYEPHLALDGGLGGYAVLDCILAGAGKHVKTGGYLIVEIGAPQHIPVRERFAAHAGYELGETIYDHSGHPRVLRAKWRG